MPQKHLYENKKNLQINTIVKFECSPNYNDFEASFKKLV